MMSRTATLCLAAAMLAATAAKAPIEVLDSYLLKANDFAREPGAAPNFAGIQAMFDVYTDTGLIDKKLDVNTFKHPSIVAPLE